jgi:hypothetical protein
VKKGSISFLKKSNKKLLLVVVSQRCHWHSFNSQEFFGSFFQKTTASS